MEQDNENEENQNEASSYNKFKSQHEMDPDDVYKLGPQIETN